MVTKAILTVDRAQGYESAVLPRACHADDKKGDVHGLSYFCCGNEAMISMSPTIFYQLQFVRPLRL